jgi:phosphatidylglycerol:prolipoprotein diacylglycerol transferase
MPKFQKTFTHLSAVSQDIKPSRMVDGAGRMSRRRTPQMTTSLRHRVSDMPEEFEAKESMEIAATSRVIRRGDCSPAPVTVSPPQSFFSFVPHGGHDGGLRLSAGSLPASPLSGILSCPCAAPVGAARQQAWECRPDLTSSRNSAFPGLLDFAVDYANRCVVYGVRYKPYWIMSDVAALSALAYAWAFSSYFPEVSGLGLGLGILGALLAHKVVLEAKAAFGRVAARSFLQDCLLIIIPTFLAISVVCKQPIDLTFGFLGLLLPLYGSLARIGCFLGGCCYGQPYRFGVLYPRSIFLSRNNGCRRYSPSLDPQCRVFPIQLVEAIAQLTLLVILTLIIRMEPHSARYIFPLYLLLYAIVRFALDCYRTTSARPRYGRFSEAQLVCASAAIITSLTIAYVATA